MSKEREKEILKLLLARKKITVNELSKLLFTSELMLNLIYIQYLDGDIPNFFLNSFEK